MELLDEFFSLATAFSSLADEVTSPVNCGCCRTSCKCCFTSLFGENKQMGEVLAKTFDGQQIWIKNTASNTKIDAMFFPATAEKFDKTNMRAE